MGKPIVRDFTQGKGILKFFPYEGAACLVPQTMVTSADGNGMKIVPAGTPFPSNDAECKGYLLHDVDVTMSDAPGTYVYQGTIDWEKVKSLSIADEARPLRYKLPNGEYVDNHYVVLTLAGGKGTKPIVAADFGRYHTLSEKLPV